MSESKYPIVPMPSTMARPTFNPPLYSEMFMKAYNKRWCMYRIKDVLAYPEVLKGIHEIMEAKKSEKKRS